MNYVSCSPFRVPIARLAAAQSQVKANNSKSAGKKTSAKSKSKPKAKPKAAKAKSKKR
jgi:hypothetical protein